MAQPVRAEEIRPYDFRRPVRLTSRVRPRLQADQEGLAAALTAALSERMGVRCQAVFKEAVESRSDRLFETPYDPVFGLSSSSGSTGQLCRIQAELAQGLVERLLGGMGANRDVTRESTDIEAGLLGLVVRSIGKAFAQHRGKPNVDTAAPEFLSAKRRHAIQVDEGVVSGFELSMSEATGRLQFFYDYEAVLEMLGMQEASAAVVAGAAGGKIERQHIDSVRLELRAQWPPTPIQIRDVAALRIGDVVHLDLDLDREVEVRIGERVAFLGHPGIAGEGLGVQITRML
jgi:flagellar motor switch protein FliM